MNGGETTDTTADGFVDSLMTAAREAATATADGIDRMGEQVGELGGAVATLAGVVERMANTVERTRGHAADTKHAVTAADWFWRRVKAALDGHRKKLAGGLAAVCLGWGGNPVGQAEVRTPSNDGGDAAGDVRAAMAAGRWRDADRAIAAAGHRLPAADRLWLRSQVRRAMGDDGVAAHLLTLAAEAGHPDAVAVSRGRGSS